MAEDPTLAADVAELAGGRSASAALRIATNRRADVLAALDDPLLAARAADVRELGRRAVRALSGIGAAEPPPQPSIVVARERLAAGRGQPAITAHGRTIRLLANASTPAEAAAALERAAEGLGLVRTELAFLDAPDWPTAEQHEDALAATLSLFPDRVVTVRTLDFGADKTPAFLRARGGRGVALTLEHEVAL